MEDIIIVSADDVGGYWWCEPLFLFRWREHAGTHQRKEIRLPSLFASKQKALLQQLDKYHTKRKINEALKAHISTPQQ
jgi:hypothetical protein